MDGQILDPEGAKFSKVFPKPPPLAHDPSRLIDVPPETILLGGALGAIGQTPREQGGGMIDPNMSIGDLAVNGFATVALAIAFFNTDVKGPKVIFGIAGGLMAVRTLFRLGRLSGIIKPGAIAPETMGPRATA